jgi:hypothetical protein
MPVFQGSADCAWNGPMSYSFDFDYLFVNYFAGILNVETFLQIIKNEDLEELRELGSGTFGTVYHGKWRGSDVAIKRIKKSCFTGRSSELERLVSSKPPLLYICDFAFHILLSLHQESCKIW